MSAPTLLRRLLPVAVTASMLLAAPTVRAEEALPHEQWSFSGIFGGLDLASAQRGFQVYNEVCSSCHSMNLLHYRDLAGIGLTAQQIKDIAASKTVPGPLDDNGDETTRPGTPADVFKDPYKNEKAAGAAFGGAAPPDQSVLLNAREGGADYIYGILTGYEDPPKGFKVPDGLYYNKYMPGHLIHMPQPLHDDQVTYADGTKATVAQEAHDVTTFLYWTSNPEAVTRKRMGVRVVLFLVLMAGLTYTVKRQIWSDVEH